MKTLSQIVTDGLGLNDKPDYFSVKAMATVIKKDSAVYMVRKKIFIRDSSSYLCRLLDVPRRQMWQKSC